MESTAAHIFLKLAVQATASFTQKGRLNTCDGNERWRMRGLIPKKWWTSRKQWNYPPETNMTGWKIHHEWVDAFPVEHEDFPMSCQFAGV